MELLETSVELLQKSTLVTLPAFEGDPANLNRLLLHLQKRIFDLEKRAELPPQLERILHIENFLKEKDSTILQLSHTVDGLQSFLAEFAAGQNEAMGKYAHDAALTEREITVLRDQVTALLRKGIPPTYTGACCWLCGP